MCSHRTPRLTALALMLAFAGGPPALAQDALPDGITAATDPAAIPATAKARKDTGVASISAPQGVFNPYFFTNGWDENVTNVIFGRLINYDSQGKLIPEQADSWTVSPDNLVYTSKLRPGLTSATARP